MHCMKGFINPNPNCWGLDIISEDLQSLVNICEAGCWSPMTERVLSITQWVNQDHCRILTGLVTLVECDTVYCHYNTESLWVTLYCVTLERVTSECDRVWLSVETWEPQLSVSRGWDISWTLSTLDSTINTVSTIKCDNNTRFLTSVAEGRRLSWRIFRFKVQKDSCGQWLIWIVNYLWFVNSELMRGSEDEDIVSDTFLMK